MFVLLQQHPGLRGVRAETIRLVGTHVALIDEEFRQNPRHHRLFMDILCAPVGVTHELRRYESVRRARPLHPLVRAGGRGACNTTCSTPTPWTRTRCSWSAICAGSPCRNTTREFPALSRIMQVAAAPGDRLSGRAVSRQSPRARGGDHSELGAVDAEAFCLEQGLGRYEARLVAWSGQESPDPVHHLAEEGHQRPGHHP